MDETEALSPTSSVDCFSDTEIDIDGPPAVRNFSIDDTPEVSACIEKTGSKVESSSDIKASSSNKSSNEARDVEHNTNIDGEHEQPRDLIDDVIEKKTPGDSTVIEKTSTDLDIRDIIEPNVTAESIPANRSQVTIVPNASMESVEAFSKIEDKAKSFESANWPIPALKTSLSHKSDVIPASATEKSNLLDSSEPTELVDELTVLKKPTVSFADDASQSGHAAIERKGSSSSKKSVKSRMSLFSARKSKDSASASKSLKSSKSGKPPMAPTRVEPSAVEETNVNVNIDEDESTLVVVGLASNDDRNPEKLNVASVIDGSGSVAPEPIAISAVEGSASLAPEPMATSAETDVVLQETAVPSPPPPPQPLQVRQNSIKSSRSKDSVKSSKSVKAISSSFDKKKKKESSSVSTPKLFGPPQQLPQWSSIPKSEKSVTSNNEQEPIDHVGGKNDSDIVPDSKYKLEAPSFVETSQMDEAVTMATNDHDAALLASLNVDENILSPPQSPAVVGPPGRLSGTASNKSDPSKHVEEAAPEDEVVGEHLLDATSTLSSKSSKQDETEEASEAAHSKRSVSSNRSRKDIASSTEQILCKSTAEEEQDAEVKDENVSKQLTIDVNDIEKDPIQAVMRPFSPLDVPVCASIEDTILMKTALASPISENIKCDNISEVDEPPMNSKSKIEKESPEKKHSRNSLLRLFSKSKIAKVPKAVVTDGVVHAEDNKVAAPAPKLTSVISKLLSPKRSAIVESDTSIEVLAARDSPSKSMSKNFGIFKRGPSKTSTGTTVSETNVDSVHDSNVTPPLVPLTIIPVSDFINSNKDKSIVEEPESQSMDKLDVDFSDNDLPKNEKDVQKPKSNHKRKSSLFGRTKASNETKRQIAKKFQKIPRKVKPQQKEHDVKLSAKIDETIVVENLHVTRSESLLNAQNETTGIPVQSILEVCNETKGIEKSLIVDVQPAPIIVVDHRSSKKVEAFGKFENEAPKEVESISQRDIPKICLPNITTSHNAADDENNRLYTSDDTVTETELTQVATLDVPLETEPVKSIPDTVTMIGDQVDASTNEVSDIETSSNDKSKSIQYTSKAEPTWIASLVDWCTPKASTDINKWMNCAGQEVNASASDRHAIDNTSKQQNESTVLDEVMSEFNECHDFYADTLNLKAKGKPVEVETSPDDTPPVDMANHWGAQLIEWMSPKSRQVVLETTELENGKTEELILETKETYVPVSVTENKAVDDDIHEGTEIALTNFERTKDKQGNRPGYHVFKGIFGKSLRAPFKKIKPDLPSRDPTLHNDNKEVCEVVKGPVKENGKHNSTQRVFPLRNFLRNKTNVASKSKKIETSNQTRNSSQPINLENVSPSTSPKVLAEQPEPPNAALFTFTSDDGMSEPEQPTQADAVTNHFIAEMGQVENLDEDVESSVNYLEIVKSKRQSRKPKILNGQDTAASKVNDSYSGHVQDIIDDLGNTKPLVKIESVVNEEKNIEYQYRVNAVSDEVVEDTKSSLSVTSSMVGDSFLSYKDEKLEDEEKNVPIINVEKPPLPTKSVAPTRAKKGMPSTKAKFLSRRKEDDSVGVSLNSNINSFNDDLSVAFAPAVGKWLW